MITQREWLRTMLPQLKVIAQVYEAHEGYFLTCACIPSLQAHHACQAELASQNLVEKKYKPLDARLEYELFRHANPYCCGTR